MFKTAGVLCLRPVFTPLSMMSLTVLLSACTHTPIDDHGQPRTWTVENVMSKSTSELYAEWVTPGVLSKSSSKVIDGYTVESGNLLMPDKTGGSLVSVRSSDGSLTALINKHGARGLLHVDAKGVATFNPEPVTDVHLDDAVPNPAEKVVTSIDPAKARPRVIDVLIGYSQAAETAVGGDAHANALAQVETVNLSLRNSLISDLSLKLVGTQVVETDYPITVETLGQIRTIFAEGMERSEPDVIYGIFIYKGEEGAGWGLVPGNIAIGNQYSPTTFAHELGHNAGSRHCNDAGTSNYQFGYYNGKSGSLLCGENRTLYYSTPALKDEFGLPRGDAVTADTARVWRENAERMSSYTHFEPNAPGSFTFTSSSFGSVAFRWLQSPRAVKYEVMGKDNLLQPYKKLGESSNTEIVLHNVANASMPYYVVAVFADGSKSEPSNIAYAKPYEGASKK